MIFTIMKILISLYIPVTALKALIKLHVDFESSRYRHLNGSALFYFDKRHG